MGPAIATPRIGPSGYSGAGAGPSAVSADAPASKRNGTTHGPQWASRSIRGHRTHGARLGRQGRGGDRHGILVGSWTAGEDILTSARRPPSARRRRWRDGGSRRRRAGGWRGSSAG